MAHTKLSHFIFPTTLRCRQTAGFSNPFHTLYLLPLILFGQSPWDSSSSRAFIIPHTRGRPLKWQHMATAEGTIWGGMLGLPSCMALMFQIAPKWSNSGHWEHGRETQGQNAGTWGAEMCYIVTKPQSQPVKPLPGISIQNLKTLLSQSSTYLLWKKSHWHSWNLLPGLHV